MEFSQIAILLVVAAVLGTVAKYFRQPSFIGYLFAGLFLAYFGFSKNLSAIDALAKVGITLLLFLVGLEMDIKELPTIGKASFLIASGQLIITSICGFFLSSALRFGVVESIYISIALTFSSTIVVVKLLSEKRDLNSLYGKITVGILLVQDLVAILILGFLPSIGRGVVPSEILVIVIKILSLFFVVWFLSKKVFPWVFNKFVGGSSELLFVASIAWALGFAALVGGPLGFTPEIGGFLAGLSLSNLPEHFGISSKTKPLRDFFLTIFFLTLGMQIVVKDLGLVLMPALIFSVFVLVVHALSTIFVMGILGYKKRTSFLTAISLSQISEFSFIIMSVGLGLGVVGQREVSMILITGVVTMILSSYVINSGSFLYSKLKNYLKWIERKNTLDEMILDSNNLDEHIVLIGCGRTGKTLLNFFKRIGMKLLVIDYNPKVFSKLTDEKIPAVLGDIDDPDILEIAKIDKSKIVISTIANLNDDLALLEYVNGLTSKPLVIVKATSREEALKLYEKGATYVLLPEVVAGEYLRHIFASHGLGESRLTKMGKGHHTRLINYA